MQLLNASIIASKKHCDKDTFLKSLLAFHHFTGCDGTRSFAGKSKSKCSSLLSTNENYTYGFSQVGTFRTVTEDIARISETSIYEVLGKKLQIQICQLMKLAITSIARRTREYNLRCYRHVWMF